MKSLPTLPGHVPLFLGLGGAGGNLLRALPDVVRPGVHGRHWGAQAIDLVAPDVADSGASIDFLVNSARDIVESAQPSAVVLLAGLGGHAGGEAIAAVARQLQAQGHRVIAGVLLPFDFEGRQPAANVQLEALRATGCELCILSNAERLKGEGRLSLMEFFHIVSSELLAALAALLWPEGAPPSMA